MISFRPTEEEHAFVETAGAFAAEQLRPNARAAEQDGQVPERVCRQAAQLGFCSLEVPDALGGLELPLISQVQVLESLAFGDLAIVQGLPGANDFASILRVAPDLPNVRSYAEQGDGHLPTAAFVDLLVSEAERDVAVSLSAAGSGYVLHGLTRPVRLARQAQFLIVGVRDAAERTVLLCLDRDLVAWESVETDIRLGLLAAGIARIRFDEVKVGPQQVLLQGQAAEHVLAQAAARHRVLEAAKEIGLMRAALEYATAYTAQRKAFGQEIARFQGVSFLVAEMATQVQAVRHLTWQAALAIDDNSPESAGHAARLLARAHRALRFVTDNGVQLLGGSGYVQEYPVEKWMRDAQAQVMLYGRETELLLEGGRRLLVPEGENHK